MDNPEEYSPKYGFVHFMWTFEENLNMKPVLVWKHEVSHTFSTPGQFKVTVQAISYIGIMDGHVLVTVHGKWSSFTNLDSYMLIRIVKC